MSHTLGLTQLLTVQLALTAQLAACSGPGPIDIRRTPPPTLVGEPTITLAPAVDLASDDGDVPWARVGATLTVALNIDASEGLDPDATSVSVTGVALDPVGDGVWSRTLDGTEGEGLRTLEVVLVDTLGQRTRVAGDDLPGGTMGFDFSPPRAECVVSPEVSNARQQVTFRVTPSEPLTDLPAVAADDDRIAFGEGTFDGRQYSWPVTFPADDIDPFVFTVTGSDPVGNPQEGASLCAAVDRTGSRFATAPVLTDTASLTVSPSVLVDGLPHATVGATVTVTLPADRAIEPGASFVSLSGVQLTSTDGITWQRTLTGTEGDGVKQLFATLVDATGNPLEVQDPTVAFVADFSPPKVASAVLTRTPYFEPADDGSGTVYFSPTDTLRGLPVGASVRITTTEPVVTRPLLTTVGPTSLAWQDTPSGSVDATLWTLEAIPTGDGEYAFTVVLEDAVGNRSTPPEPLDVRMVIDTEGPTEPLDVDTPGLVVLTRAPWGSEGTDGVARAEVVGLAGAVPAGAVVVAQDTTSVLASTRAESDGSFSDLRIPGDRPEVLVAYLDEAGNPSPSAPVRDGVWTASLGGKTPGERFPNPHRFTAASSTPTTLVSGTEVADVALLSTSGGSVTTQGAEAWQAWETGTDAPPALINAAMAYDPVRDALLLYGGYDAGAVGAVWRWEGHRWVLLTDLADGPGPRRYHAMTFDPSRKALLVYGGWDTGQGDTWSYDGTTWTQVATEDEGPGARNRHGMAYDPARGEVVVYGGIGGLDWLSDTWIWDGTTWRDAAPTGPTPGARQVHSMAPDAVGGGVLLFGGNIQDGGVVTMDDTWRWDGSSWHEVGTTGPTPPPRHSAAMVSIPSTGEVILSGGYASASGPLGDHWRWDGSAWSAIPQGTSPAPAYDHRVAYDAARERLVWFGGNDGTPRADTWTSTTHSTWDLHPPDGVLPPERRADPPVFAPFTPDAPELVVFGGLTSYPYELLGDTWSWDGDRWREGALTGPSPAPRYGGTMVWDAAREEVVLFGGWQELSGPRYGDTWTWDGTTWTDRTPSGTSPDPRSSPAMVFDPSRDEVVLFGGYGGTRRNDTWTWNGARWVEDPPVGSPPPARDRAAMAYDEDRDEIVLFGGTNGSDRDDTWVFDGSGWQEITPVGDAPEARTNHAMAYDPGVGIRLIGGTHGSTMMTDQWVWSGTGWARRDAPITAAEPARISAGFAIDPVRHQAVLFGGDRQNDLWVLGTDGAARPHHAVHVATGQAGLDPKTVRAVTVRWRVGGEGHPPATTGSGAVLQVWDVNQWIEVARHSAGSDEADTLVCWMVRADDTVAAPPDCTVETDPTRLRRLFLGRPHEVHARVFPVADNGATFPAVDEAAYGRIRSTSVEVEVVTRRP